MTLLELLDTFSKLRIRLTLEEETLRCRAPSGTFTEELRAELAAHKPELVRLLKEKKARHGAELPPVPRGGPLPLSPAQQSLWLLNRLAPESLPAYNVRAARRLRGALRADLWQAALVEAARRHEALRTAFVEEDGAVAPRVGTEPVLPLEVVDLSALSPERQEAAFRRRLDAEGRHAFDLARAPLLRAVLLPLGGEAFYLILTAHHLIADAWSAGIMLRDLAGLYEALAKGAALPPPPARQYLDYVAWQQPRLAGLAPQVAYWKERLAGVPVIGLPGDAPRPARQTFEGASASFRVPAAVAERFRALSRAEGTTLFMTLLAAFAVLLRRLTGQDDLAIGTTVAGRDHQQAEELIGFFVNMIVVREDLSGDPSFREVLRRTRQASLDAFAHQEAPFDLLVKELHPARDLSHNPLFQVCFLFLQAARDAAALPGIAIEAVEVPSMTSKFDLSFHVEDDGGELRGLIEYKTGLFSAATIARFIACWDQLAEGLGREPDRPVAELPMLPPADAAFLREYNRTGAALPALGGIDAAFDAQCERTPDAVAAVCGDESATYRELQRRADAWAARLRAAGVGPDVAVGVCAHRSIGRIAALLGILKAGGAYLPLDPAYPADRLRLMIDDARPKAIVGERDLAPLFAQAGTPMLFLDEPPSEDAAVPVPADAGRLAYVIYTSGSTGKPKGVMVTHRNVLNFFQGMDERLGPGPGTWLAVTSISFDISVLEMFWTLSRGFKVVLPSPGAAEESVGALIERHGATHLQCTPSLIRLLAVDTRSWNALRRLRQVLLGGEALSPALAAELAGHLSGELHNMYGPTETTVWSTTHRVRDGTVLLGRPIANTQIHLLDGKLQPVPLGVAGEIHIGGEGVTRGYLDRPALTAERFVADPFDAGKGRLYRTGDLARFRPDGGLEYLGRIDQQVKLGGHRIELGEIEAALASHPGVRAAVAAVRAPQDGEARLVAYYVPAEGATIDRDALRDRLAARLPSYMVPGVWVALDVFPLTPNGKIDRKGLPDPAGIDEGPRSGTDVAPRTPREREIADIWSRVLGLACVGVNRNFFDLGGHSLLAMQVIARIRQATGVELPLRALFEKPTVADLAERLDEALEAHAGGGELPLRAAPRTGNEPLSFAQQRLWFLEQLTPGQTLYNLPAAVRLRGPLDGAALEKAFSALVERHEALRTRFGAREGEPFQIVAGETAFRLERTSWDADTADGWEALAIAETERPFDLEEGPLFRARLFTDGAREHLLIVVFHHIVADGWSMGVLVRELGALYEAFAASRVPALPVLPIQYPDYALWQRKALTPERRSREVAYWRERLGDAPSVLELPGDRPRPPAPSGRGAALRRTLEAEPLRQARAWSGQAGVTLFTTLLAAFYGVLSRHARQTDLVVGTSVANRQRTETEGLIGFFVNMLALRIDLSGGPSFTAFARQVQETCLGAYAHQDLPFDLLVDELVRERDMSRTPLFQVMFVMQNAPLGELALGDLAMTRLPLPVSQAKFDLTLMVEEIDGELACSWEYNTDLFEEETVARLATHWERFLSAALARPETAVDKIGLLNPAERRQLTVGPNAKPIESEVEGDLVSWFRATAQERGEAIAATYEDQALSYRDLDRRSNGIAAALIARGVAAGDLVGLCAERSLDLVAGLLGILKAGGAYLPLDPGYPTERLRFMLEDSRAGIVVAQGAAWDKLGLQADVLKLEDIASADRAPSVSIDPSQAAYVIYTSGSTGQPKGVVVTHHNVVRLMRRTEGWYDFGPNDVWTLFHSYAFDFSVWELWGALLYGGKLVVVPYWVSRSPEAFHDLLQKEAVTVLNQTPSAFRSLIAVDRERTQSTLALRYVIFGGEALELASLAPWIERHGDAGPQLINMYGITETTVHVTYRRILKDDLAAKRGSVIGKPIPDLALYVVDAHLEPVPVGVPGELLVEGAGLAQGYLHRPELTAERFVANPFGPGTVYRTGDLARWLCNGDLEYLGRIDQQVKIRGFRIELGEIEAVLQAHPQVAQAVVVARSEQGSARLAAYWVARENVPAAELRAWVSARLPDYMVPSTFARLERVPLTHNGKLDMAALPKGESEGDASRYRAPANDTETRLCAIWSEVLGIARVGGDDNFFELGGHSLLATQLMARIRTRFQIDLPLRLLFEGPTVAQLAAHLAKAATTPAAGSIGRIQRVQRRVSLSGDGELAGTH